MGKGLQAKLGQMLNSSRKQGDGMDEEDLDERGGWSDLWTVKFPEGQTVLFSGYHRSCIR